MAPLGRDFKCQIKPVLTIRRSPTFNCNILNPDKFTYKSHKPTCQSNKLHQLTTIHTLIFIIQRMQKIKMFYLFSLFVNWKMKMLNIQKSETGWIYIHTHTHSFGVQCHRIAPRRLAPSSFAPSRCCLIITITPSGDINT